jgi:hypothetical protein
MLIKKVCKVLFLFATLLTKAQVNLVPNPSFETYTTCPNGLDQINFTVNWYKPTSGSPDYFNACYSQPPSPFVFNLGVPVNFAGNHAAYNNGQAYAGLIAFDSTIVNYREYIQTRLNSPLVAGIRYYLSFYVSLVGQSGLATDGLGAYVSTTAVSGPSTSVLNVVPQVANPQGTLMIQTTGWTKIQGSFFALGGEEYITIGSFNNDALSTVVRISPSFSLNIRDQAYYYIDQVCLSSSPQTCDVEMLDVSTGELTRREQVLLYYDHCSDRIRIQNASGGFTVRVADSYGSQVKMVKMDQAGEIDVSDLPNGFYFVNVNKLNKDEVKKIVIFR